MKTICAFSSDHRPLYKGDIYRTLAFPVGHILHFRYKTKYVDANLRAPNANLREKKVVIFYVHGNNAEAPGELFHVSIRQAKIVDHYVSTDTDVFHVYMQLGEFCNVQLDSGNSVEKMPGRNFFAELNCTFETSEANWQARVTAVKDLLPPLTYFFIKGISCGSEDKKLHYSDDMRSCYYQLSQGRRHILRLAVGNPNTTKAKIGITEPGKDIAINVVKPLETSAQFDDFDIPLIVEDLQIFSKPALLSFDPELEGVKYSEFATNVETRLRSGVAKPALFGLLTTIALGAFTAVQPRNIAAVNWLPIPCIVAAGFLFWAATAALYFWFNKK
ncbi:MAG TPA: hypothetical protein VJ806_05385 [Luteimonas sp.]|nr:hypothetical protein [Luteimonas sp.]